jgi:hypothetical protein
MLRFFVETQFTSCFPLKTHSLSTAQYVQYELTDAIAQKMFVQMDNYGLSPAT